MATHLDLEEQEQLDQLKAFWKQYGNLLTWVLIALLGAYAAWTAMDAKVDYRRLIEAKLNSLGVDPVRAAASAAVADATK